MYLSFRTVLIPQCQQCRTEVTDDHGRPLLVDAALLNTTVRDGLRARGWTVTPGNPRVQRTPTDTVGGDTLRCPVCITGNRARTDAEQARQDADFARPRVTLLDLSARLGPGWTLGQRNGDEARHRWLVEYDGQVRGYVQRYRRTNGTFSTGWEAFYRLGISFPRREAIAAGAHRHGSSFLWSGRDLAAWGVAANPPFESDRPEWAARKKRAA
ncbi:hypothetical protein ACFRKD_26845 [Streptomyces niveus]|uniref:hypothetical protein n=1 Tax=Streptomyces niveus TaxID=193462 RepID=UPI003684EC0E